MVTIRRGDSTPDRCASHDFHHTSVEPGVEAPDGDRVALITVGALDRRAASATAFATRLPADQILAVHIAVDRAAAHRLARSWSTSVHGAVPLQVVNDLGGVATTIRLVARELLIDGAREVTVVVGRLAMPGLARLLLHDHTAGAIARAMSSLPGARVAMIAVCAEDR
jgi:hypothetical protein